MPILLNLKALNPIQLKRIAVFTRTLQPKNYIQIFKRESLCAMV